MAVRTRTLSINAAFLADIKEDNRRLRSLLSTALEQTILHSHYRLINRERVELYVALRDQLALHFTLEDAFGYFRDALDENPRLSYRAERLHAQHDELYCEMCELVDLAEQILYGESGAETTERLTARFLAFYKQFTAHEREENDLIFAAFDDDIGVGD